MSRTNVWIEVAHEWIEVALVWRARVRAVHRVLLEPGAGHARGGRAEEFAPPPNLEQNLLHALSRVGARRANVHVLWHAQGMCVDMQSIGAPPQVATSAAGLAFTMTNALDPQSWATNARVVATRKIGADAHETCVLVSAMHHDVLRQIECAVEEAGCTLRTVVPAPSIALLLSSQNAIEASRQSAEPVVGLHVDEEAAAIAIASDGALLLARTIEMGYATLRQAYLRAIRAEHATHPEAFLAAHKRLLETDGIPLPKSPQAIEIFEYVRPYLQRLFIEIKQTVRFTLDDDKMQIARVLLGGPGATIPRLAPMLADEIGFESVRTPPTRLAASEPGFGIAEASRAGGASFGVQPPGRLERQQRSSRRTALLYGAAAAALILAGATYSAHQRAVTLEREARALDRELADWRAQAHAGSGMNPRIVAESLDTLIQSDSGLRADWGAALAELVASRPGPVRFRSVSGSRDRHGSWIQLEALTGADEPEAEPHAAIARFVEALESSPLVADTRLGATEQLEIGAHRYIRFALAIELVETRAPWASAEESS